MRRDPDFQDHGTVFSGETAGEAAFRPNIWQRASRVMEFVIYGLLILAVGRFFVPELERRAELKAELTRLERIAEKEDERVTRLRQEHRLLKTDREYLETVARDRLNLQREGEYIIRIERDAEE